jgi:hypothetical protein
VYNLTVEGDHEFFAAGVLTHNCDALRYAVVHADQGFGTLWEPASVVAQDRAEGAPLYRVLDGEPKFRYGDATRERRGKRLFGGGA